MFEIITALGIILKATATTYFDVVVWNSVKKALNIADMISAEIDVSLGCAVGCVLITLTILSSGITPLINIAGIPSALITFVENLFKTGIAHYYGVKNYDELLKQRAIRNYL